jgi:uncharacterized protein with PIN domain
VAHSTFEYKGEKYFNLGSPNHPNRQKCPECDGPLRFRHTMAEQWGACITYHHFYTCRGCREKCVITNDGAVESGALY